MAENYIRLPVHDLSAFPAINYIQLKRRFIKANAKPVAVASTSIDGRHAEETCRPDGPGIESAVYCEIGGDQPGPPMTDVLGRLAMSAIAWIIAAVFVLVSPMVAGAQGLQKKSENESQK